MVMIGVDPHKRTHTAVAIDEHETVIGERLVHARAGQVVELVGWADQLACQERVWAVESAGGLGYLLAQQLLAAGEHVVDVPATLASRVRLLGTGRSDKNDPNDARSVAIAALRAPALTVVRVEDHATVLRMLAFRPQEPGLGSRDSGLGKSDGKRESGSAAAAARAARIQSRCRSRPGPPPNPRP